MRRLVVSITIALALSRLAGSGWAIAGATQMSAATKARTRIMETPGAREAREGRLRKRDYALAGKFGLEFGGNRGRYERGEVAAHARDLAHQCGGDRADRSRGRDEHRTRCGRHGLVHAGQLHLVVEIGAVAQAPDHDGGPGLPGRRDRQIVIGGSVEGATGLFGDRRAYRLEHLQTLFGRKQRLFAGMDRNRNDQAVAQGDGVLNHVQMAVGDGGKRAGIKRTTGHTPLLTRPGRPGKPAWIKSRAGFHLKPLWFPAGRLFIWGRPMNQFHGRRVCLGEPAMFRPLRATKQNSVRMKPFSEPAKTPGNLRWVHIHPTKRRAETAHDRGPS